MGETEAAGLWVEAIAKTIEIGMGTWAHDRPSMKRVEAKD